MLLLPLLLLPRLRLRRLAWEDELGCYYLLTYLLTDGEPGKTGWPQSISPMMQPTLHMSTPRWYAVEPSRISGARYLRAYPWVLLTCVHTHGYLQADPSPAWPWHTSPWPVQPRHARP